MLFEEMGLSPKVLLGLESIGFTEPTPIQEKVIPILLSKKCDLIGLAQTGTGKTAAYVLPALENIDARKKHPQLLILCPTRELCIQITKDIDSYSSFLPEITTVSVYGGASIENQLKILKKGAHIVVATPGRINDIIRRKRIDLSNISSLVLDEADEMLKMGFREDIDLILEQTPPTKNTLLFSATMAKEIMAITKNYMHNPVEITIGAKNAGADNVSHICHNVPSKYRYAALKRVVDYYPEIYGIVFCRTRQETKEVASLLMQDGYNAEALHGDLSQSQRDHVMKKFREKKISVLVGTDVAARGLDVNNLSHVINYNLPDDIEVYNHRSGRTGRAGKTGIAISITNMKEKGKIKNIERFIKKKIEIKDIPEGKEICERQLFYMIEKMKTSIVQDEQINKYMDKAYSMLSELSKEDIIKRFVSLEFDRFLSYYKNAPSLNFENSSKEKSKFDKKESRRKGLSMARVLFNIGKGKGISKREIIDIVNKSLKKKDVEIGKIEIYKRSASFEIDKKFLKDILKKLNNTKYKGINIEAKENYEYTGY